MKTNALKSWFYVLLAVHVLTLIVHSYLSLHHYEMKLGLASGPSLCNLSSTFNCDSVAVSAYSSLSGVPVAILGLFCSLAFLIFLTTAHFGLSENSALIRRGLFWFALFIFAVSLMMGSLSLFVLGTYCLFCISAYALSLIGLIAAWKFQTENPLSHLRSDLQQAFTQARWVVVILVLIPAVAFTANLVVLDSYGFGKMDQLIQDSLAQWESGPSQDFKLEQGLQSGNGQNPKFTIVEFADFLCPHCKVAYPILEAFVRSHPDTRLVFKSFPLDGKCNKNLGQAGDGLRCKLAGSVYCAEKLAHKGWEYHHWFFDNQEKMSFNGFANGLTELEKKHQIKADDIRKCLDEDATTEALEAMALEGANAKIAGTPSIFVNGKQLERGQFLPVLDAAYKKSP